MTFYQKLTNRQNISRCVIRNEINQRKAQEDSFDDVAIANVGDTRSQIADSA